ncbi:MAG: glycosyltransferase family 4 protein [Clostridia bacterium]
MKKICFINGVIAHSGGTERVGIMIANELSKRGYDVTMLSFWDYGKPFFECHKNIKIDYLLNPSREGKLYRTHIYPILKLHNYIQKNKFDIVIDIDTILSNYTTFAIKGTKTKHISWEHFNYLHTIKDKKRIKAINLAKKYSDKIVVLTKKDYNLHFEKAGIAKEKLEQIYNPTPFEGRKESDRSEKLVIAVGRLTDQKGFDLLLESWSAIEKTGSEWTLAIIGSGEDDDKLKNIIIDKNLKNVQFIPATNEIEKWYDKASVFVLPSRYEGFPMVLLEAMVKGLPIVAFDCFTGPSEMIVDGKNSFLAEDGNVDQFAEKLNLLLNDEALREEFSNGNKLKVKEFYLENIVNQWENMIKTL